MNWRNTQDRYGSLSIGMHWLMLLLMMIAHLLHRLQLLQTISTTKTWTLLQKKAMP